MNIIIIFFFIGFANIPITVTTRKTLIKKLRLYLQNAGSSLQKSKDLVSKYSSDEESAKPVASSTEKHLNRQKKSISGGFSRPSMPFSSFSPHSTQSITRNSKNIYVSPVYINNDSDEESFASKHSTPTNSIYRQNSSFASSGGDDLDSTSNYTKRLLQVVSGIN